MNLTFDSVTVSHFRCFAIEQTLQLSELEGLVFVRGNNQVEPRLAANGAGKSSLFMALCWCLYGKTPDGLRNPDIKPWSGKGTPTVTVRLRLDDAEYVVTRVAKTNGLLINEKEVGADAAAELIGLSFEVFTNTVLLAQGLPLFFDRPAKDKMQLFADVLGLERWEERSERASQKVRELERLESELVGELHGLTGAVEQTKQLFQRTKQDSEAWETARQERLKHFEENVKNLERTLEQQNQRLYKADLDYDGAGAELKLLRVDLAAANAALKELELAQAAAQRSKEQWERELANEKADLADLSKAKVCPTCKQPLKREGLQQHKEELQELIAGLETAIKKGQPQLRKLEADCAEKRETVAALTARLADREKVEDTARTELDFLKPQVARLEANLLALRASKSERSEERNPYLDQVAALRHKQQKLEADCAELEEDIKKAARQIERTRFWVKGFKDVKLFLIEDVLQELELTTNVLLAEVGLDDWQVKYDIERETKSGTIQRGLNVTILSPQNTSAVKWESFSGGEGQRLRLVGSLALSEVLLTRAGVEPSLEILDEPTRHLSPAGVQDLTSYLSERARMLGRTVLLIDHTAREGVAFAGTVTVTKTAKGSVIQQ